jgi:hypothetical protein
MDKVRCMLILAGRESLFSDIRSVSEPAVRFFWAVDLKPFEYNETKEAIKKPLKNSSITFDDDCIRKIHELSQGHPYFVQVFAYNLFSFRENDKITLEDLNKNYSQVLSYVGMRLFDSLYNNISLNEQEVIQGFTKSEKDILSNTEISELTNVKSVNRYLKNLSDMKPAVLIKEDRGRYKLFHPLFKEYLKRKT